MLAGAGGDDDDEEVIVVVAVDDDCDVEDTDDKDVDNDGGALSSSSILFSLSFEPRRWCPVNVGIKVDHLTGEFDFAIVTCKPMTP